MTVPRLEGLDVSANNGPVDWFAAHAAGVRLCSIRATTGTDITDAYRATVTHHAGPIPGMYVDGQFGNSRANAKAAGITHRLFYHLLNGDHSLEEQADHFLRTVMPLGPGEGVLLDYEVAPWTVAQATAWCEYVEARTGRPVAIYGGVRAGWRDPHMFDGRRPRWLANWLPEARARAAAAPHWGDAWQWTSKGTCPGVGGRVDLSQVDHLDGFNACCGLGADPMPITPPVYGPYGKVADGARYSLQGAQASRDGVVVHTYESAGDTLPLSRVRANLATPGDRPTSTPGHHYGVSYHAFPRWPEGPAGEYDEALDEHAAPNSAGSTPNRRFLHFCLWGRAAQTREQWLDANSYPQLQALARYIADKSVIHGFPVEYVQCVGRTWGALNKANIAKVTAPGKIGVLGHRDITACKVWGGTHGDPGPDFPWDVVIDLAHQYLQGDDDMAQLVNTPGDAAEFEVSGTNARWIPDWSALVWQWDHGLTSKKVTTIPRADLKRLHLFGPEPAAAGSSTIKGSEFASWTPAA